MKNEFPQWNQFPSEKPTPWKTWFRPRLQLFQMWFYLLKVNITNVKTTLQYQLHFGKTDQKRSLWKVNNRDFISDLFF